MYWYKFNLKHNKVLLCRGGTDFLNTVYKGYPMHENTTSLYKNIYQRKKVFRSLSYPCTAHALLEEAYQKPLKNTPRITSYLCTLSGLAQTTAPATPQPEPATPQPEPATNAASTAAPIPTNAPATNPPAPAPGSNTQMTEDEITAFESKFVGFEKRRGLLNLECLLDFKVSLLDFKVCLLDFKVNLLDFKVTLLNLNF